MDIILKLKDGCWNEVRVNSNNYSEPYVQNRCFTALLDNKFICMALNQCHLVSVMYLKWLDF